MSPASATLVGPFPGGRLSSRLLPTERLPASCGRSVAKLIGRWDFRLSLFQRHKINEILGRHRMSRNSRTQTRRTSKMQDEARPRCRGGQTTSYDCKTRSLSQKEVVLRASCVACGLSSTGVKWDCCAMIAPRSLSYNRCHFSTDCCPADIIDAAQAASSERETAVRA